MSHNDVHPAHDALDEAIGLMLRAVLTADEQQLLAAFEAIADPQVRHALIEVACAAAGFVRVEGGPPTTPPPPRSVAHVDRIRSAVFPARRIR